MTGFLPDLKNISLDDWNQPVFRENELKVSVWRLDKIHPFISGNKWFKLKYYLEQARQTNKKKLASFGGAYSNHLLALSAAGHVYGFSSIGFIRGEEPKKLSPTLFEAKKFGMELRFLPRTEYDLKKKSVTEIDDTGEAGAGDADGKGSEKRISEQTRNSGIQQNKNDDPGVFLIPEGGAGREGIRGAEEILSSIHFQNFSHICCAAGTGATLAGLINIAGSRCKMIGVSVLKGTRQFGPLNLSWIKNAADLDNVQMIHHEHFGGYAKFTAPLLDFMNRVYLESGIPTDFVYTGKLFYAVDRMAAAKAFPAGSRILVLHTGGLQGNSSLGPGRLQF